MKTKVVLEKDVPSLGVAGDVKEVAPGYARNYLLPYGLAVPATPRHLARWSHNKEKREQESQQKLIAAQNLAKQIQQTVCSLSARAGKDGKLFGAVTPQEVARFYMEKGLSVDRRWVELREPIRATGEFAATVRLHPEVRATIKIVVQALSSPSAS